MRRDFEIAWMVVIALAVILTAIALWSVMLQQYQNIPEGANLTGPGIQFFIHLGVIVLPIVIILLIFAGLLDGNGGAWEPPLGGAHL